MSAHWGFMAPHVNAFLVPGSTGDAWEMSNAEVQNLIDLALKLAADRNAILLIGVLKDDALATRQGISELLSMLEQRTGKDDPFEAMKAGKVCGFTICPPRGSQLTQEKIEAELESVLDLSLPIVLYQLPQVTKNEMSPSLVGQLADRYPNLMFLKDSSGEDRVALEADPHSSPVLLRGAEGDYAQWLQESGGPYHGLLLSTANCFPRHLKRIVALLEESRGDEATALSDHLTQVVEQVFALVADMPDGNAFSNANKAVDHYMAFGADARLITPPILHAGTPIPKDVIQRVGEVLESAELIPLTGYMNQ
jgi:dihydrodipicolinate synthase/N-acetylneuraminate lyase